MPDHAGTDGGTPKDHVNDAFAEDSAHGAEDVPSVREKQLRLLFTFPILLGLFICALNLLAVTRLWRSVYFSNLELLSRANLPNTVCFTLMTISFFIGLALIVYAIALRHFDGYGHEVETPQETVSAHELGRAGLYLKWLIGPLLIAIPAPALTVWAAETVEPIAPKPCIELYQQALTIKENHPNFTMVWNDRDELRCSINDILEQ